MDWLTAKSDHRPAGADDVGDPGAQVLWDALLPNGLIQGELKWGRNWFQHKIEIYNSGCSEQNTEHALLNREFIYDFFWTSKRQKALFFGTIRENLAKEKRGTNANILVFLRVILISEGTQKSTSICTGLLQENRFNVPCPFSARNCFSLLLILIALYLRM